MTDNTNEPLRLGIAGLGTVGRSVARLVSERAATLAEQTGRRIAVVGVSARDRTRERGLDISGYEWFDDPVALARAPSIDVFVELIGGADGAAKDAAEAALDHGKTLVTANKALLAAHGLDLARRAEEGGGRIFFEAAVAGGIPIIKALREALAGNRIASLTGILNGTCNYILTRMTDEGIGFDECLAEAQRLGYAEADPTFDVDGFDSAHKLAILTSIAFGTGIDADAAYVEGIRSITVDDIRAADELGYKIKLLGVAQRTDSGIEQRVHPALVPRDSDIARIDGVTNAVAVHGDFVGTVVLAGPGAGGDATASAVVGDIVDAARGARVAPLGRPATALTPYRKAKMRAHEGGYYLRLSVEDQPGAFAAIAQAMASEDISLDSIVQRSRPFKAPPVHDEQTLRPQTVVIVTHETTEDAVRRALATIEATGRIAGAPQMIRIETD